jgi:hypothetical protein
LGNFAVEIFLNECTGCTGYPQVLLEFHYNHWSKTIQEIIFFGARCAIFYSTPGLIGESGAPFFMAQNRLTLKVLML